MDSVSLWLAVHGSMIGITSFVSLIVGGFLLWPGFKRLLIRIRSRRLKEGLGTPLSEGLSSHIDEVVTLVGQLRAGGEPVEAVEGIEELRCASAATLEMSPTIASSRRRAHELWLEVGEERVELDGRVDVVVGSRELYPPHGVSGHMPVGENRVTAPALVAARWIEDGLRVRVRGVLERVPTSTNDATYRAAAPSHLSLKPEHDERPSSFLEMASERYPRVIGSPWSFTSIWVAMGVGGSSVFISALLLWLVGAVAMEVARRDVSFTAAAVASTTPLARKQALQWMTDELEARLDDDEALSGPYITLQRLQHRLFETYSTLMEAELYEHAASVGYEAGHVEGIRVAAQRMARQGRFDVASDWFERARQLSDQRHGPSWREEVLTHLLADRLERAAAITALEARNDNGHRQCIADAIAARAGDEQAFGRLIRRAALSPELAECQLLRADAVPAEARIAALEQCRECRMNSRWARIAWLLHFEALLAIGAHEDDRARVASEASYYMTSSYLQLDTSESVYLFVPGLERHVFHALDELEPTTISWEERRFLERLAYTVGLVEQLARPTNRSQMSEASREELWTTLWPDPLWTMAVLSAHFRLLQQNDDPRVDEVEEALERYHEALSRRDTAVLIDVFAAW